MVGFLSVKFAGAMGLMPDIFFLPWKILKSILRSAPEPDPTIQVSFPLAIFAFLHMELIDYEILLALELEMELLSASRYVFVGRFCL